jgi:hypothetical protein
VQEERIDTLAKNLAVSAKQLIEYNSARVKPTELARSREENMAKLMRGARDTNLPTELLEPFLDWILPHFSRADYLALQQQKFFYSLGVLLFFLPAIALAFGAAQILTPMDFPILTTVEVGILISVLVALALGRRQRAHERWITYRALTEQFRSGLFVALAGANSVRASRWEFRYSETLAEDWPVRAFDTVWSSRPRFAGVALPLDALREFLATAWLGNQIQYHINATTRHDRLRCRIEWAIVAIFAATLVAAVLHVLLAVILPKANIETSVIGTWLPFLPIVLPALGGALGGLAAQRDHQRHALRSSHLSGVLSDLQHRLRGAGDMRYLLSIVQQVEGAMSEESRDWFAVMLFHDFELHA